VAGSDPSIAKAPGVSFTGPPAAIEYDPGVRGYPQHADGSLVELDPVDAGIAIALGIEFGTVPSAPDVGNKMRRLLNRVPPQQLPTVAKQEVERLLAPWTSTGQVKLLTVVVDTSRFRSGVAAVAVTYQNLTLQGAKARPTPPQTVWM
jgi:hypothetical protein